MSATTVTSTTANAKQRNGNSETVIDAQAVTTSKPATKENTESKDRQAIQLSSSRALVYQRPIEPSSLRVVETGSLIPGNRPVFASDLKISNIETLPGHRPVFESNPKLLQGEMLLGNRPIASNDLDGEDSSTLMGYID